MASEAALLAVVAGVTVSATALAAAAVSAAGAVVSVVVLSAAAGVAVSATTLVVAVAAAGVVTDWAGEAAVQALSNKTAASSRLIQVYFE